MSRREREQSLQDLLGKIEQQRLDIQLIGNDWLSATSSLDHIWFGLVRFRRYFALGGGLLALWSFRRPAVLKNAVKRTVGLWSGWRMVRKLIGKH